MKLLLITPPMVQLNTAYPATPYLTGFLRTRGHEVHQADLSIELALKLLSRSGLTEIASRLPQRARGSATQFFIKNQERYLQTIDSVISFLQGRDPSLALRIVGREFLPEGERFRSLSQEPELLHWAFGTLGTTDQARHLASLYLDDLSDMIRESIDPRFEFSRYAEKIASSQSSFDDLSSTPKTLISEMLSALTCDLLKRQSPEVVCLTIPFPGNLLGALMIARTIRKFRPSTQIVFGGGYVNTELRELGDARIFDDVDFITLDDGERPLECILEYLDGKRSKNQLLRTFVRENGKVRWMNDEKERDIPFHQTGTPTYDGLPVQRYLSLFEMLNPMHRIWSDTRWNKVTLAHGCYWKKCTFCDTSLDYIGRYEAGKADLILARMKSLRDETGQSGFHFVDEAAPPALLKALSQKIIDSGEVFTWWGNIRFEKSFTPELAQLMARAGCVAVTGGLEVASPRILKLIQKGVSIEQVFQVTGAFSEAGILVHAYLMYGFPTQTEQETIESLEVVRQLFEEGCLHSAFWHRFSATIHSPIGKNPEAFGIQIREQKISPASRFGRNDLPFFDPTGVDHDRLGAVLKKATYNFMHGVGLDRDVREWFQEVRENQNVSRTRSTR